MRSFINQNALKDNKEDYTMALTESTTATAENVTDISVARKARNCSFNKGNTDLPNSGLNINNTDIDLPKNRRFDANKVARLKAAIADGSYQINASSIANKFIEHDRN